eukprot:2305852-Rhodomonas_salina.2
MHLVATFTDSPTTESTIASLHVALHRYACESSFSVSSSFSCAPSHPHVSARHHRPSFRPSPVAHDPVPLSHNP